MSQDTDSDGLLDSEERALVRTLGFGPAVAMTGNDTNPEIVVNSQFRIGMYENEDGLGTFSPQRVIYAGSVNKSRE